MHYHPTPEPGTPGTPGAADALPPNARTRHEPRTPSAPRGRGSRAYCARVVPKHSANNPETIRNYPGKPVAGFAALRPASLRSALGAGFALASARE